MNSIAICIAALLMVRAVEGQVTQQPLAIAPQPADLPPAAPNAPFAVTVVSYQALPPNNGYSFKFVGVGGGKAVGNIETSTGIRQALYDPTTQTVFPLTPPGTIYGFDGMNFAGVANGRCFGGNVVDQTPSIVTPTPRGSNFFANYYSECVAIDNGVPVGTQGNDIFTITLLTGGESSSVITGRSQTAFVPGSTEGPYAAFYDCCSRARAIKGDEVVGDLSTNFGLSFPVANPLDTSPALNPHSSAVLWKGIAGNVSATNLAGVPSVALATNGSQQGGWAGSHAVMWSGSAASMVDLNPAGYFDSRVSGMAGEFQVGDGWFGGPANTPGAVRHALLWRGSAASVVDLNQYLSPSITGAAVDGVDIDGNIIGRAFYTINGFPQELGLYFRTNPAMSLASFTLSPPNPAPGVTATGTVTLMAPAGPGGLSVTFTSSDGALVPATATLVIPEGQATGSFNVASNATSFLAGPAPVTLTARTQLNFRSVGASITPTPATDPLASLIVPSTVVPGDTVNIKVNLAAPAPAAGVLVNFSSSNTGVLPTPSSVLIPEGQSSTTVSVVTNSTPLFYPVPVTVQGQTGTSIQQASVMVATVPVPGRISLDLANQVTSVQGGTSGAGTVWLTAAANVPGVVTLASNSPALKVPASISYAAGNWGVAFNYSTLPIATPTTGTLTATTNGSTLSVTTTITASPTPSIRSLQIPLVSNTQTWSSGETLTGTIVLNSPAFVGGMTLALSTDTPAAVQIPASVTIPSLGTTVTFPVTALAVAVPTQVLITATVPGLAGVSVSLTLIPGPALGITSYALAPYSMIGPGVVTTATVTINQPAPVGGVTLSLFSNNANAAKLPSTAAVAAGQTSATFTIQGNGVPAATAVNLMASYSGPMAPLGTNATTILMVAPTDTLKAPKPTWSTSTHLLTVTATSTNPQAIITLLNASGNVPLGTMINLGSGNYSFQTMIGSIASVNFKSNLGGATGQGVTVVP